MDQRLGPCNRNDAVDVLHLLCHYGPNRLDYTFDCTIACFSIKSRTMNKMTKDPHDTHNLELPNGDFLKSYPGVTRVELITNWGREIVKLGCSNVKVSLQDDGRTISEQRE